jgi:hypothetical protein
VEDMETCARRCSQCCEISIPRKVTAFHAYVIDVQRPLLVVLQHKSAKAKTHSGHGKVTDPISYCGGHTSSSCFAMQVDTSDSEHAAVSFVSTAQYHTPSSPRSGLRRKLWRPLQTLQPCLLPSAAPASHQHSNKRGTLDPFLYHSTRTRAIVLYFSTCTTH